MYSSIPSVNTLTVLLVAHGIRHAVVCPGSRNAPIVHNLSECPDIRCYPVTDERSAAFFALGIAQATDQPVVVCVTSGTALLNTAPAVAEAYYQQQSLVIISADRPAAWIDQLDGQTLRQPGVLSPWVECSVSLPENDPWHCNRLVNEALIVATSHRHSCVHINVPISEPLFHFTIDSLPVERVIRRFVPATDYDCLPQQLLDDFMSAERPLIVFGQLSPRRFHYEGVGNLFSHVIVLHEALAPFNSVSHFEALLSQAMLPDFILYVGDAVVSKRLKHFLRRATEAHTWRVQQRGGVEDTFQNLRGIVEGDTEQVLMALDNKMPKRWNTAAIDYRRHWLHLLSEGRKRDEEEALPFGQAAVVRELECLLATSDDCFEVHYANSTAIRLANRYAKGHPVWCNRGTNGIDGSLSTAAGFSAVVADSGTKVLCVIGDLSFFYDQNALWNQNLGGNLRILLLNNGRGGIFDTLPGLEASPVARNFVAGSHKATAKGICKQNDIRYLCTDGTNDWPSIIARLLTDESDRPVLLEVFHGHG